MKPQIRILVFSDSHGELGRMEQIVMEEWPDAIFHLGDYRRDSDELSYVSEIPVFGVTGNCDGGLSGAMPERKISLGGVTFLLCHGHTYGVKSGYSAAVSHAKEEQVDVLLCGHTHIPLYDQYGSLQLLNPGSIRYSKTYGLITIDCSGETAVCAIKTAP